MGPQSGHDADVDAIDLTLSSPEPEARPHTQASRHLQQQQPVRTVKQEPGSSYRSTKNESQRQGTTRSGNVPQQQPRRINPHHVKQIVDTSSSKAVREVLLLLCASSQALSGAVTRGLAPHSPWAQALIHKQQAQSHAQRRAQAQSHTPTKSELGSSGREAHERMKQRLGVGSVSHDSNVRQNTQTSASRPSYQRPNAVHENRDGLRLPRSSQKPPTVKREYRASPTDSDDSTNIVDFPALQQEPRNQEYRHHTTASSASRHQPSANLGAEGLAVRQRSTHHAGPDHKPKLCIKCGELFNEGGDITCEYHPGGQAPTKSGDVPQYTCCGRFEGEPACKTGRHMSERNGHMTNAKRSSPSPYGGSSWSKRPKVL